MQPRFLSDAEEWFARAESDLNIAKVLLDTDPVLGEGVAFHAQQAAEKSLKGFLEAYGQPFPKTHDVLEVLNLCEPLEPTFKQFTDAARTLSPYAVEFRYPGKRLEPPEAEARAAYRFAADIYQFVRAALANADSSSSN